MKRIHTPFNVETLQSLRAGESVLLSGVLYTARDAAHARLTEALAEKRQLPVELKGQTIYYAGPSPTPPGRVCGSIGPTTSVRMDAYTPRLLSYGVKALIGKGDRGAEVEKSLQENGCVYFAAIGGCAAYMAGCVQSLEVVAYDDLGTESIKRVVVQDMPLIVAIDAHGENAYRKAMRTERPEDDE